MKPLAFRILIYKSLRNSLRSNKRNRFVSLLNARGYFSMKSANIFLPLTIDPIKWVSPGVQTKDSKENVKELLKTLENYTI